MTPSAFLDLPRKERAFIIAAIDIRVEREKKKQKEIERTQGITRSVKLEQEQLMIQLAPAMQMAQEHIDTVIEARRFYGAFGLLSMQNHLMELNPDNFQHFGYRNWDEVMAQRISIKGRLYDMGIDPNQSLVAFVGSNLQ